MLYLNQLRTISPIWLAAIMCAVLSTGSASAQLAPNQTVGYGDGKLVTLTYLQNFDCIAQPGMDLNFNGKKAESDPDVLQTPICQAVTEPTEDPSGVDIKHTAPFYVLIPFFSVNHDQNPADAMPCPGGGRPGELCGTELGKKLIALFGAVPEAWKSRVNPAISTQCPDPKNPVPGTCPMHASSVDLSKVLVALKKIPGPPTAPVFVPDPNHSHVVEDNQVNMGAIWWEVRPVLVLQQSDWPSADAKTGITSKKALAEAEAAGRAIEVGSNFFLFFSSKAGVTNTAMTQMSSMGH